MDDKDDEMGHLYTGLCDTRVLARTMLEIWETEPAVDDNDTGETILNRHLRWDRERSSTPHALSQLEILTRLRRLNSSARIYKE